MREHARPKNSSVSRPIGAVLAGGRGRRIGGAKALVELAGRPLVTYPLDALGAVLDRVAVVAKEDTRLPSLPAGVEIWIEPSEPRHPVAGIIEALRRAAGHPVLVCAADMPFVTAATVSRLTTVDPAGAPAVIAAGNPLLGLYLPEAAERLVLRPDESRPLRRLIAAIDPVAIEVDGAELFNVNTPADLDVVAAQPNVKL